jgi:hypothetical protein
MTEKKKPDPIANLKAASEKLAALPVMVHISVAGGATILGVIDALTSENRFFALVLWLVITPIFLTYGISGLIRESRQFRLLSTEPISELAGQGSRYAQSVALAYYGLTGFRVSKQFNDDVADHDFELRKFGGAKIGAILLRVRDWDNEPIDVSVVRKLKRAAGELENAQAVVITNQQVPEDARLAATQTGVQIMDAESLLREVNGLVTQ